jgi:hypothetical protein
MRKIDATIEAVTGFASLTGSNTLTGANRITGVFTVSPKTLSIPANAGDLTISCAADNQLQIRRKDSTGGVWVVNLNLSLES